MSVSQRLLRQIFLSLISLVALVANSGCEGNSRVVKELSPSLVREWTDENFQTEILESRQPVLVDVWAAWCDPCLAMKPVIQELAEEFSDRVKVGDLDSEVNLFTVQKYEIEKLPTVLIFLNGEVVERLEGQQTRDTLIEVVDRVLLLTARQ